MPLDFSRRSDVHAWHRAAGDIGPPWRALSTPSALVKQSAQEQFFGIDLGTTNSLVAWGKVTRRGSVFKVNPRAIEVAQGPYRFDFLPSVVYFDPGGGMLVGQPAKDRSQDVERVCRSVKLKLGTQTRYRRNGQVYSPTDISAIILARLKQAAEQDRNCDAIQDVVITVPASFDTDKRVETLNAARIAFFDPARGTAGLSLHLLDEPTAALLAFLDDQKAEGEGEGTIVDFREPRNVLIFDFGGGTLDVSIVQVQQGGAAGFHIVPLGLSRYTEFGGDDLDLHLGVHLLMAYAEQQGVDLAGVDPHTLRIARRKFQEIAERAKIDLNTRVLDLRGLGGDGRAPDAAAQVEALNLGLPGFADTPFHHSLSAAEFAEVMHPFLDPASGESAVHYVVDTLSRSGLTRDDIDYVLVTGGCSQLWCVRDSLLDCFGFAKDDGRFLLCLDPIRAIARGAVIQHHFLATGCQEGIGVPPTLAESIKLLVTHDERESFVTLVHAGDLLPMKVDDVRAFSISTPGRGERQLAFRIFRGDSNAREHLTELTSKIVRFDQPQQRRERIVCSIDMGADKILNFHAYLESRAQQRFELSVDDGLLDDDAVIEARRRIFSLPR
ncbi:MAG: Hsp70 family protein [Planctomycetes bacterium]|nr:Hsp70 family protein [Planctomycetota bacterium]